MCSTITSNNKILKRRRIDGNSMHVTTYNVFLIASMVAVILSSSTSSSIYSDQLNSFLSSYAATAFVPSVPLSHTSMIKNTPRVQTCIDPHGRQQPFLHHTILQSRQIGKSDEGDTEDKTLFAQSAPHTSSSTTSRRKKKVVQEPFASHTIPNGRMSQSALSATVSNSNDESVTSAITRSKEKRPVQKKVISIRNGGKQKSSLRISSDTVSENLLDKQSKQRTTTASTRQTTTKSRTATSTVADYAAESLMMRHDLLSFDEEQELGIAIHKASQLQKKIDDIVATKFLQQQDLQESIEKALEDDRKLKQLQQRNDMIDLAVDMDFDDEEDDDDYDDFESNRFGLSSLNGVDHLNSSPNLRESYYVGSDLSQASLASWQQPKAIGGLNTLQKLHSKSRISVARLQRKTDEDDTDTDNKLSGSTFTEYDHIDETAKDRRSLDSVLSLVSDSSDFFGGGLTDDEIRTELQIEGGKDELRQILIDGAIARDTLISSNLKLVSSIAKKWSKLAAMASGGMSSSDNTIYSVYAGGWDRPSLSEAIQEGTIGLVQAVERYNPRRGLRFSTYATYWITNTIRTCFRKASTGTIRVPVNYHDAKLKYKKLVRQFYQEQNEDSKSNSKTTFGEFEQQNAPTIESIAKQMSMSPKRLRTILQLTRPLLSIDAPIMKGVTTRAGKAGGQDVNSVDAILLSDTLVYSVDNTNSAAGILSEAADPTYAIELSFLRQCLENAMANELAPHERDVVRLRLGLDDGYSRSCKEVSQCVGGSLSSSEVRSTELRAFKKLRSPETLSTYKLLSYLDFADLDMASIKFK